MELASQVGGAIIINCFAVASAGAQAMDLFDVQNGSDGHADTLCTGFSPSEKRATCTLDGDNMVSSNFAGTVSTITIIYLRSQDPTQ